MEEAKGEGGEVTRRRLLVRFGKGFRHHSRTHRDGVDDHTCNCVRHPALIKEQRAQPEPEIRSDRAIHTKPSFS